MKSDFNERRENRKERYEELADKNAKASDSRYTNASELGKMIPMGQPILIGHHSEASHRAHLKKIDTNMRKSIEHDSKAKYYEQKAQHVESDKNIYSDDPEALVKLREKLNDLQELQTMMKAANKICRKKGFSDEQKVELLISDLGLKESKALELVYPRFSYYGQGFQSFKLTNNNANIRRVKDRIAYMERQEQQETQSIECGDVQIIDNKQENRVQIFFGEKPSDEIRTLLKSRGFRWSRNVGCWQRHCSSYALQLAKEIAEAFNAN